MQTWWKPQTCNGGGGFVAADGQCPTATVGTCGTLPGMKVTNAALINAPSVALPPGPPANSTAWLTGRPLWLPPPKQH